MKCKIRHIEEAEAIEIDPCPISEIEDRLRQLKMCGPLRDHDNEIESDDYCFDIVRHYDEVYIEIIYGMEGA